MIPNILWQTWKTKELPHSVKSQADSWSSSNPQLHRELYNDLECANFILEHFGENVHGMYMALPQPIMRADFWRLAVVYIRGGYYSDLDIVVTDNIKNFIKSDVDAVFMLEIDNVANFFFGAAPNHPVIKTALDKMIEQMRFIKNVEVQNFGMHWLHQSVREHYAIVGTNYTSDANVQFLHESKVIGLVHTKASTINRDDYESWRSRVNIMNAERTQSEDVLFFTTFNASGYELYGKTWIQSFINVANYYNTFRAKIYYEGFEPAEDHPSIEWIKYEDAIPFHPEWKADYLSRTQHADYVKTMTVRFSHKAFVIHHALTHNTNDYIVWLDGDCVFNNADYTFFPTKILNGKSIACQVEHNHDLNHVESGILIFDGKSPDKMVFANAFYHWYKVDNILPMGQPYDGFLVFKTLLTTGIDYEDLNGGTGGGGIQSDPSMTFRHPELRSKFIHNIGWTGKNQYENWEQILKRDDIYQKMKKTLFGQDNNTQKKIKAHDTLARMRRVKALHK